jgi:hypothetical protein
MDRVMTPAQALVAKADAAREAALLTTLFDRGGPMTMLEPETALRWIRRDIFRAIRAQHQLGNIRRFDGGVTLTAACRFAIQAARGELERAAA